MNSLKKQKTNKQTNKQTKQNKQKKKQENVSAACCRYRGMIRAKCSPAPRCDFHLGTLYCSWGFHCLCHYNRSTVLFVCGCVFWGPCRTGAVVGLVCTCLANCWKVWGVKRRNKGVTLWRLEDNRDCQFTLVETTLEWRRDTWYVLIERIQEELTKNPKLFDHLQACRGASFSYLAASPL